MHKNRNAIHTLLSPGTYALEIRLLSDHRDLDLFSGHVDDEHVDVAYEFDFWLRILPQRDEVHVCLSQGYQVISVALDLCR